MRFDDRLVTVLNHSVATARDRAVQWRQLVELLARGGGDRNPALRVRALERIDALASDVPYQVRAAAARSIAHPDLPLDVLLRFVTNGPDAAAPLLAVLDPGADVWAELRAAASPEVRAVMDAMQPPPLSNPALTPGVSDEPVEATANPPQQTALPPPARSPATPAPRIAQPAGAGLFRWECGPTGEIDWIEGAPRAALIGRSIADELDRRFAARLPFDDELMPVAEDGALAGEWRWSGSPAFFPDTGRFAGYHGIARRQGETPGTGPATVLPRLEPDELRELVHELRTPLNAIIGFGEIIDGQYLGPAHRAYRERAAEIVDNARRLLAAVEDVDLAAKLRGGRQQAGEGSRVEEFFPGLRTQVVDIAAEQGVSVAITLRRTTDRCALPAELAVRLASRFLGAIIGVAAAGERLELVVDRIGGHLAFALDRPQATAGVGEEKLLDPAYHPTGSSALGIGFALRLVRGLATLAGGGLDIASDRLVLRLPLQA